jgi:hypothetical protein
VGFIEWFFGFYSSEGETFSGEKFKWQRGNLLHKLVSSTNLGSFYRGKSVSCHVRINVYKGSHLKVIAQPTTTLEIF